MAISILKHGLTKFRAVCTMCKCDFTYEMEDVNDNKEVVCPECYAGIHHNIYGANQPPQKEMDVLKKEKQMVAESILNHLHFLFLEDSQYKDLVSACLIEKLAKDFNIELANKHKGEQK